MKRKIIKLKLGETIPFQPIHESLGRAEFEICPIFKYGKLKKIRIYPRQQEVDVFCYEIEAEDQEQFRIESWAYKGIESPRIWLEYWCKEDKTICHRVYVPNDTDTIEIEHLSTLIIRFIKK
jgi:hypothetical protein